MPRPRRISRRRVVQLGALAALGAGCGTPLPSPAPPPPPPAAPPAKPAAPSPGALASPSAAASPVAPAAPAAGTTKLTLGLPATSAYFLPLYLAAERTAAQQGLTLEVIGFQGGAPTVQALAGGSVDLVAGALSTLLDLRAAGQAVRGFYAGFNHADLAWFGTPEVRSWTDLKGRVLGVGALGDATDVLSRYILKRRGLEPERDVQIVALGGAPANRLQALEAGRVQATLLSPPFRWQAEARGLPLLGQQSDEVGPEWPANLLIARERLIEERAADLRSLLRAHVAALRLTRTDREPAIQALGNAVKLDRATADRTIAELLDGWDERGQLTPGGMASFWTMAIELGQLKAKLPEAEFFDRRFVDAFDSWAPAR
jgi:NitT/TauT family transport system substrate-binding protein